MKPHLIVVSPEFCTEESARCLGGRERIAGVNSGYRPRRAAHRKHSKDGKHYVERVLFLPIALKKL